MITDGPSQLQGRIFLRRAEPSVGAGGWSPIWFLVPALIALVLFTYLPALLALIASLFEVPITGEPWDFLGLENYQTLIADSRIRQSIVNTILYSVMTIVPTVAVGFALALLVNTVRRGRGFARVMAFLPATSNLVAMAVVFRWIFAAEGGFANQVLSWIGLGPLNYLGSTQYALPTVALVGIWRGAALAMIFFLAGLTTIPATIDEAAAVDGIRGWRKLSTITIPMLRPTIIFTLVIATLQSVQIFDTIQVMTGGGPLGSTETILTMSWRIGFRFFKLGLSAALTFILISVLLAIGALRRRMLLEGAVQ